METITLRDVALKLAKIEEPTTRAIADTQLLSLLKSGELKAGFEFPGRTKHWVAIHPDYWLQIDSRRFRSIRKNQGATFKVSVRDFADEYLKLIFANFEIENGLKASNESLKDELRITLRAATQKYEVVMQARQWEDYRRRHNLPDPSFFVPAAKGKGGRHPLAAWRKLSVIIPAYLLAHHAERHQPPAHDTAAEEILQIAKGKGFDANSLPQPDTLSDVISQIYKMQNEVLR
jgi:hypothetical protein